MSAPKPRPIIFQKLEDYANWDILIQDCDNLEEFSDFDKDKAKRAFQFLRSELGESFIADALKTPHPFMHFISNLAPWTRKWVTWFAEALKDLKGQDNYASLLSRLKNPSSFDEAMSILEIAHALHKNGFQIAFDSTVMLSGRKKVPDLKITNLDTKEEFYIEVTILEQSKREKSITRTHRAISDVFIDFSGFLFSGQVYKVLSEPHLAQVTKQVKETYERCKKERAFQELSIAAVIDVAFAPESDRAILEKWTRSKGLDGGFSGPPIDVNDVVRCLMRIEEEQKQLPTDRPNIVVIESIDFFWRVRNKQKAISELEEEVYTYPHLLGVAITGEHIGSPNASVQVFGNHIYATKTWADMMVTETVFLTNKFCSFSMSPASLAKIQSSFR